MVSATEGIAGLLLAAGMSRRMGQAKMLLPWDGQPLVYHLAAVALAVPLAPVVVVTGFAAAAVSAAVADLPVQIVHNPLFEAGQSSSLLAGLAALGPEVTAVVILLVDQPLLTPEVIRTLLIAHRAKPSAIIAPTFQGQRGNPVLFPRTIWPELQALRGDQGARAILQADPQRLELVPLANAAVIEDADTPEEYAALLARAKHI